MRAPALLAVLATLALSHPASAQVREICAIVADGAGRIVHERGDCDTRVTPASTFKVALAVIGYDTRTLIDAGTPVLPFREGYPDWGGEAWRRATGPTAWMHNSVVWYSREIASQIGAETITRYLARMGYGNADFSGDPGKDNALERAWISSSLKISPREQVAFLSRLNLHALPVNDWAQSRAIDLLERHAAADGWRAAGKTGSAYPRRADGSFDRAAAWGWYAGWMERGGETYAFAYLRQDEARATRSSGLRARTAWLDLWLGLADDLAPR